MYRCLGNGVYAFLNRKKSYFMATAYRIGGKYLFGNRYTLIMQRCYRGCYVCMCVKEPALSSSMPILLPTLDSDCVTTDSRL